MIEKTLDKPYLQVLFGEELKHIPISGLLFLELCFNGFITQNQLIFGSFVAVIQFDDSIEVISGQLVVLLTEVGLSSAEQPLNVVGVDGQRFITIFDALDIVVDFEVSHRQIQIPG